MAAALLLPATLALHAAAAAVQHQRDVPAPSSRGHIGVAPASSSAGHDAGDHAPSSGGEGEDGAFAMVWESDGFWCSARPHQASDGGPSGGAVGLSLNATLNEEQRQILCLLKKKAAAYFGLQQPLPTGSTCAVVSSSGAHLKHEPPYGKEIDGHSEVMRFNTNPTKGFEARVGAKTTLRFGWAAPKNTAAQPTTRPIHHDSRPPGTLKGLLRTMYPDKLGGGGSTEDVTTGFHGMMIALSNCDVVDAYEMAPSEEASNSGYNYYGGGGSALSNGWHGFFKAEHDLWTRLSVLGPKEARKTGKTRYPGFAAVQCLDGISEPAHLDPVALSLLEATLRGVRRETHRGESAAAAGSD